MSSRTHAIVLIGVGVFALVVRLAVIAETADQPAFRTPAPGMDSHLHWQASGELLDRAPGPRFALMMESAPGYPLFLAGARWALPGSMQAHRATMAALGSLSVLLMYWFVWRDTRCPAAAAVSAIAMATLPSLVFFDSTLHKSGLEVFLLVATLAWLRGDRPASHPLLYGSVAGALLAALLACQLSTALMALAVVAFCWLQGGRSFRWKLLASLAISGIVASAALSLLWVSRTQGLFHPQAGIHMRIGFHEGATGGYREVPGIYGSPYGHVFLSRIEAERAAGRLMTAVEANAYHVAQAWDYIAGHPTHAAMLVVRKVGLVLNNYEAKGNEWFTLVREQSTILGLLPLRFGLLLVASVWGVLVTWRRGPRDSLLLLGGIALAVVSANALAFVNWRYRLQLVVPMIALAGPGTVEMIRAARRLLPDGSDKRAPRRAFLEQFAIPGIAAAIVTFMPVDRAIMERDRKWAEHNASVSASAEAQEKLLASLQGADSPSERVLRAELLRRLGRHTEAFRELSRLVQDHPADVDGRRIHLEYLAHLGRAREATASLAEMQAAHPGEHARVLAQLPGPVLDWIHLARTSVQQDR